MLISVGPGKADVQASEVGVQPGILNRQQPGHATAFIDMGMPMARRGDEGSAGLPVDAMGIANCAVIAKLPARQGVTAGITVDDQIEGHGLMPMRRLNGPGWYQPEHRPEGVTDRTACGQILVGQQDA